MNLRKGFEALLPLVIFSYIFGLGAKGLVALGIGANGYTVSLLCIAAIIGMGVVYVLLNWLSKRGLVLRTVALIAALALAWNANATEVTAKPLDPSKEIPELVGVYTLNIEGSDLDGEIDNTGILFGVPLYLYHVEKNGNTTKLYVMRQTQTISTAENGTCEKTKEEAVEGLCYRILNFTKIGENKFNVDSGREHLVATKR